MRTDSVGAMYEASQRISSASNSWGGDLPDDRIPAGTKDFDAAGQPDHWPLRLAKAHWAALLPGVADSSAPAEALAQPLAGVSPGAPVVLPTGDQGRGAALAVGEPWEALLAREARAMLDAQAGVPPGSESDLMQRLARRFERTVIRAALERTRGRRIEAAQRLGIGRNTITRKIQELGIDED